MNNNKASIKTEQKAQEKPDALTSLINKINNDPIAAAAMKEALAKTKKELKQK
ncbi:hypothetical protein [Stenoxybacter acetivorans]|uniref:hypothetical protein n=1 Tax=Stenoxybacter acetivorans TaxID=422441 RepID=UPI0012EC511A|nr:hypothetical protein [Stenoxybacter acetivorans]